MECDVGFGSWSAFKLGCKKAMNSTEDSRAELGGMEMTTERQSKDIEGLILALNQIN